MEFRIRKNNQYLDVVLRDGTTVIELGLLDKHERIALANTLQEAIDELTEGLTPNVEVRGSRSEAEGTTSAACGCPSRL